MLGNITQARNNGKEDIQNRDHISQRPDQLLSKTALDKYVRIRNIQADLTHNMSAGTLRPGLNLQCTPDNDLKYDTLSKDNQFVLGCRT